MDRCVRAIVFVLLPLFGGGCTGKLEAPKLDADAISARAMKEYDVNKDGFLDAQELERCPGLKSCLKRFDSNNDGRLSEAELRAGLAEYVESGVALTDVTCKVTVGDQPLVGAAVLLDPEAFMADSIKPARGTTNDRGVARVQIEGANLPGCHLGIYRVRITKPGADGQESVPARYNAQTQLGIEVGPGSKGNYPFRLNP
jgi:hypothetical protein